MAVLILEQRSRDIRGEPMEEHRIGWDRFARSTSFRVGDVLA